MDLDVVAEGFEFFMCITLLRFWVETRPLEFNEEWLTTRQPEDPVWPRGVPQHLELRTQDAEVVPCELHHLELDGIFED
jgi:hypothetical protein